MPGSPAADFHPAGADLPPAAGDPGAAPRPAQRDTGGQAGVGVPPGRSSVVGKRNGRHWDGGAPALSVCAGDEQLAHHAVPCFAHPVFRHPHVFQR